MNSFIDGATRRAMHIAAAMAELQVDVLTLLLEINEFRAREAGPIELPRGAFQPPVQDEAAVNQGSDCVPHEGNSDRARSDQFVTFPEVDKGGEMEPPEPASGADETPPAQEIEPPEPHLPAPCYEQPAEPEPPVYPQDNRIVTGHVPPLGGMTLAQFAMYRDLRGKDVGGVLRRLRALTARSGREAATDLKLSRGLLFNYERGAVKPSPERLTLLCGYYELTLDAFFDRVVDSVGKDVPAIVEYVNGEAVFAVDEVARLIKTSAGGVTVPTAAMPLLSALRMGREVQVIRLRQAGGFKSEVGVRITLAKVRPLLRTVGLILERPSENTYRVAVASHA